MMSASDACELRLAQACIWQQQDLCGGSQPSRSSLVCAHIRLNAKYFNCQSQHGAKDETRRAELYIQPVVAMPEVPSGILKQGSRVTHADRLLQHSSFVLTS
jgi:hypothetical protein